MDKFNRNYKLIVQKNNGQTLTIEPPFTVEFEIHRNSLSSANICQIRIFNLSPDNRGQLRKDQFDFANQRTIEFQAGYGNNLAVAFKGSITQAWSVREGVNIVTQIESFDGGYAYVNAITDEQFVKNTPQASIIDTLVTSLRAKGVQRGAIGNYGGLIPRGNSYSGTTADLLGQITNGGFFIDNGKANCLNENECLLAPTILVNAATGLLGTPVKEQTYINFDMLFEPSLKVGQLIDLQSETADQLDGQHKVLSIVHRGVISAAVCGDAITSVGLLPGVFTPISQATP